MNPLPEVVSLVKDLSVILGAAVAGFVAVRGLGTWNRQLRGGVEYDLARRLLRSTYRLREVMREARNPTVFGRPEPVTRGEAEPPSASADELYAKASEVYERRCSRISDAASELRAELLEAEVLWGAEIGKICVPMFDQQRRLVRRIQAYLVTMNSNESAETRLIVKGILNSSPEIMYDLSIIDEPDPFWTDFTSAISELEDALRPHLRK